MALGPFGEEFQQPVPSALAADRRLHCGATFSHAVEVTMFEVDAG
jgi:hypothetical protein